MAQGLSNSHYSSSKPDECSHLASGEYRANIASLCTKYPNLRYPDLAAPVRECASKVVALDLSDAKKPRRRDFLDTEDLRNYVKSTRSKDSAEASCRHLYVIEGLDPQFTGLLGQFFDIDPLLIMRQQRTASWESYHKSGNMPTLPSLFEPSRTFHLPYYELHYFPQGLPDKLDWRCADSGRQIGSSRLPGTFDRVGIVDRKVSYWGKKRENGGWDGWSSHILPPCTDTW